MPERPALVVLGASALPVARRLQAVLPASRIHGKRGRADAAEVLYDDFGATLRGLYRAGTPLVVLCAAGIVIRALAPLLADPLLAEKRAEPPVLAVAEDGSAVVPLLGGLAGVNALARQLAAALGVAPAITTSGELRFGSCLLDPPPGYTLADLEQGKRLVSDLLNGATVRIEGEAPWLEGTPLPRADAAARRILISPRQAAGAHDLLIHPRVLLAWPRQGADAAAVREALTAAGLAPAALAALLADPAHMADAALAASAAELDVPLRFLDDPAELPPDISPHARVGLHLAATPAQAERLGRPRGRLSVVGLGPGAATFMAPAVRAALDAAEHLLGYATYLRMAGPFRADQKLHPSDNREELQRAAHAFALAAQGRRVVLVSSGDPGVFAMAAAVLEALENAGDPRWHAVELEILPGISAALATAARAGAPLGHDCCLLSLSDNLKPWEVIERRLDHAAAADLAMAFYNPISQARPWQLGRALEVIARHRTADTVVVLGRDIGRPGERLTVTTLGELTPQQVDMRTLLIVGSSTTRRVPRADGGAWVYTPRWYPRPPD